MRACAREHVSMWVAYTEICPMPNQSESYLVCQQGKGDGPDLLERMREWQEKKKSRILEQMRRVRAVLIITNRL